MHQSAVMADRQAQRNDTGFQAKPSTNAAHFRKVLMRICPPPKVIFDEDMTLRAVIHDTKVALTPVFSIFGIRPGRTQSEKG